MMHHTNLHSHYIAFTSNHILWNLYILNAVRCPYGVRSSVTVGVASSVANDVTVTIAGLWRYGDWRHVATGCTALVLVNYGFVFYSYF